MEPVHSEAAESELYEGMVENLVTQFSSALDCFRELVQNSIDAGSPRVEVWMEFLAGEGHEGTIAIHVEDFGEGMDEAIIDDQFTRLFASTKDDDLTKIGKFGIGFVSVFALRPKAVIVHTGRGGEYWEVLFHEDRSFSKTRVDNPVEGTQVAIFLTGEIHRYQELAEAIPATLRHWCSHSEVEITFEDRSSDQSFAPPQVINEGFEVEGECVQWVTRQGTEIVLGYHERPVYGFFNRGLTLALTDIGENVLGRWAGRFEFISFKIKSRYLEHTLSRDSVVQDEQYVKAMKLLVEAANGPLLDGLIAELEELAQAESWSMTEQLRYGKLMGFLAREPSQEVVRHRRRRIFRCLHGQAMSLQEAWEQIRDEGRLLLSPEATSFTEFLAEQEIPVVVEPSWRQGGGLRRLLVASLSQMVQKTPRGRVWAVVDRVKRLVGDDEGATLHGRLWRSLAAPQDVYFPVQVDTQADQEVAHLLKDARRLLKDADAGYRGMVSGVVEGTAAGEPLFVVAPKVARLMARPPERWVDSRRRRARVVVNRAHPRFAALLELRKSDPALAAFLLARALLLQEDRRLEMSSKLLEASLSRTEMSTIQGG